MTRFIQAGTRTAAIIACTLGGAAAGAQSIASRVAAAGQGEVRMTFATRANVCGDGGSVVAVNDGFTMYPSMESYGRWSNTTCVPGRARVALRVGAGGVETIRTRVGGSWEASSERVTDLGAVPAAGAAAYFLDLVDKSDGRVARNALLAAVIADSADVVPRLLSIAERTAVPTDTRRRAIHWLGVFGDASMIRPLTALARSSDDDKQSVGEAALFALSRASEGAGIPALIDLARHAPATALRSEAVFWLGQSDDASGRREVRAIAGDNSVAVEVREKAIFALGQRDAARADDFCFLRDLFGRVDNPKLRERILMAVSQSDDRDGQRWLLSVARDESASTEARKKAIFWAGQSDVSSTAEIAGVYDKTSNESVKEHTIFVLSQRDDQAATDKLMAIVNGHDSPELRKKALFWLGQKDDPAVTRAIADLVTRP